MGKSQIRNYQSLTYLIDDYVVEGLSTEVAGKNATLQFQDEGVDISTKGAIEYVNFTGAGVTASLGAAGVIDVDIPGGGGGAPTAHAASHKLGGSDVILLNEFGDPSASIQFNKQQALQFVLENRTSDPGSPADGQIWLRTDL